jgi:hypothetical protein
MTTPADPTRRPAAPTPPVPYPVSTSGELEPSPNRWLWLVKWLLLIPHFVVLALLWVAFFVLSVMAFFAILFTGRYPHTLFDFNVGVLRWTWRVGFYGYSALGTDRYPPFTLEDRPDYPARFSVAYPARLSRGLVLVKWWLLAIPHLIIVGILSGAGGAAWDASEHGNQWGWAGGLIGILVLVAGVVVLFTGTYPRGLFDFVMGLNRWVFRVAAYVGLMTDDYPPFRLDMGGQDPRPHQLPYPPYPPGSGTPAGAVATPGGTAPVQPYGTGEPATHLHHHRSAWTAGRVVAVVLASLVLLVSLGLASAGTALLVADNTLRDDDGYLMTERMSFTTGTGALTTESMELSDGSASGVVPEMFIGKAKLHVVDRRDTDVFVGIGRSTDVDRYLDGVAHAELVDVTGPPARRRPVFREEPGGAVTQPPESVGIWDASVSGPGSQSLVWEPREGDWTIVVMNADGSPDVAVSAAVGATVPVLSWGGGTLLVLGLGGLLLGSVVLAVAIATARPSD